MKIIKLLNLFAVLPGIFMLAIILFSATNAEAYLDPATGSLVLQILIASILAALVSVRSFWKRLTGLFKKSNSKNEFEKREKEEIQTD